MWPFSSNKSTMSAEAQDPAMVSDNIQSVNVTDITYSQLLDAVQGTGDDGLSVIYKPRLYSRNSAICLVALNRAVSLLSGVTAQLLSNGHYRIVDKDGNPFTDPAMKRIVEAFRDMMSYSLDGFDDSAMGIKDAMCDYLLDGNFLFNPRKNSDGGVERLVRLIQWSAQVENKTTDGYQYTAEVAHMRGYKNSYVTLDSREVVHGRMAQLSRIQGSGGSRNVFARAPVVLMRPTLEAGLALDEYVRNFARAGHRQNLSFNFKPGEADTGLTTEQKKELADYVSSQQRKQMGFIVQNDGTTTDITPKIDPNLANLREWEVQDVARFYGVPGPLIALNLTSWGQGIGELGRMFVNYSVSLHVGAFCDALAFRCLPSGARIEPNYHKLLKGDAKSQKDLVDAMRGDGQRIGVGTLQECRDALDLPRTWDGELVNQNPVGGKTEEDEEPSEDEKSEPASG